MITLTEMAMLAHALRNAEQATKEAEDALKAAKERERFLREESLPSAMQELGLEKLVLDTGETIEVKQEVYAQVPAANKGQAYRWLDEHGFGGLIKTEVKTIYSKGEKSIAQELARELVDRGLTVSFSENVHASTLKAFLKEQLSAGTNVPLDLFGARPVWTAKLK